MGCWLRATIARGQRKRSPTKSVSASNKSSIRKEHYSCRFFSMFPPPWKALYNASQTGEVSIVAAKHWYFPACWTNKSTDQVAATVRLAGVEEVDVLTGVRLSGSFAGSLIGYERFNTQVGGRHVDDHVWYERTMQFE
jgi:hypothetical protein